MMFYFAYDLRFVFNIQALVSGLPVIAGILGILAILYKLIKRKRLLLGGLGLVIALILIAYLGVLMHHFPSLVLPVPINKQYVDSQENKLMSLVLQDKSSQGYDFVAPMTSSYFEPFTAENSENTARFKTKFNEEIKYLYSVDFDFSNLIDQLIEVNRRPVPLTIKSSFKDGYYIDYYDIYNKWIANFFGVSATNYEVIETSKWDIYRRFNRRLADYYREREKKSTFVDTKILWDTFNTSHPDVRSIVTISKPAYDPETGYMLIVYEGGGTGSIDVYKYENGRLIYLGPYIIWIN